MSTDINLSKFLEGFNAHFLRFEEGQFCIINFVQLCFSSNGVTTDKKSSSILIYPNKDTGIYTEIMALIKMKSIN